MSATLADRPRLDHLVVLADTLDAGAAGCEQTLGVTPAPGGAHPLFGTHNRLLAIGGDAFALAYLEIIAVDPDAPRGAPAAGRRRWFDMDDAALRAQVRENGPRLIHWVARVPDLAQASLALAALEIDRGEWLQASRDTPRGRLEWQITVRPDGQRLFGGCLPTLIQWGARHPAAELAPSGVRLQALALRHPQAALLAQALAAVGLRDVAVDTADQPELRATLATPRGAVTLSSTRPARA